MMLTKLLRGIVFFTCAILVACNATDTGSPASGPVSTVIATPSPGAISSSVIQQSADSRYLILWLPPQFDPEGERVASAILKQRLQEFESLHPGLEIDVRIKDETQIVETLQATASAAPSAMPDLIAMPHGEMQEAALAGYLHPIDGVSDIFDDPDWYGFARELGKVQNTEYGIAFAADSLVMVYRPAVFNDEILTWDTVILSGNNIVFPLSDSSSLFPVALYLSGHGTVNEELGVLQLDEDALIETLYLIQAGSKSGAFLPSVREINSDEKVLEIFREGSADLAVVHISSDINSMSGNYLPLMGIDDTPYSLGSGWVWSLAGSNIENQLLAGELAAYLTDSDFLSGWVRELNYLPPRPNSLHKWDDPGLVDSLDIVLQNTVPAPPDELLQKIETILQHAVIRVLDGDEPESVAQSVIEDLQ